jgi:type IX secretion system PorP/SprF family membrane protein
MSVKKYLSVLALCVVVMHMYGQQQPQISHYMFNTPMYNPASAGFTNSIVASGIHRQQWYGVEGRPEQTQISIDAPIKAFQSGIGVNIFSDQIGSFNNTFIQLAYNYQIPFLAGTLGMGINFGLNSFGLKPNFDPRQQGDAIINAVGNETSSFLADVGMGFFYSVIDQYEVGVSLGSLNAPRFEKGEKAGSTYQYHIYGQKRSLNLSGNYNFTIDEFPRLNFVPSTLIKSDFTTFQIDLSLIGFFDNLFWGGISYRLGDAIVLLAGMDLQQFQLPLQVGGAYDISTSWMSRASKIGGGFELFVRYSFNLSVDRVPQSYKNSRFL